MRPDSGDQTELELLRSHKLRSHKLRADTGSRRKRQRWGERPTVINVVPASDTDLDPDRDPIIRVYSEDSAYVDTTLGESGGPGQRISFMMESAPSQDTEFTELRLSSFYSQDEILDTAGENSAPSAGDTPGVAGDQGAVTTDTPGAMAATRTLVTMSSLASTEFDPFRSQDCLLRNGQPKPVPGSKRYSIFCVSTIVDFIQGLLFPDKFPPEPAKVEGGDVAGPPGTGDVTNIISDHQTRLMSNFRGEGRVTTGCLWHACRAVTIGIALIVTGISLTIIGYLTDQREYLEHVELSRKFDNYTSTKYKDGRFHLSHISFSGPVVLGIGGFLLIVACVMTLEARDNAAKIVPATACLETTGTSRPHAHALPTSKLRENKFKTSASQTAILDKNIVAVLTGSQSPHSSSTKGTGPGERQESSRRFSSGSAQLPGDNSGSGGGADTSDRDRQARTMAFVNGDCGLGDAASGSPGQLPKCPSAPCIVSIITEERPELEPGASVSFNNETQQSQATDKWWESIQYKIE